MVNVISGGQFVVVWLLLNEIVMHDFSVFCLLVDLRLYSGSPTIATYHKTQNTA